MPDRWVHFKINDVWFPEPGQILRELHGKDLLQGRVLDTAESGPQGDGFLVVEVEGLSQPVVVPLRNAQESM